MTDLTRYSITHGPVAAQNTLRFVGEGTARVDAAGVAITGTSVRNWGWPTWIWIGLFVLSGAQWLMEALGTQSPVNPVIVYWIIIPVYIAQDYIGRPRERTQHIQRDDLFDVVADGCDVNFVWRSGKYFRQGVLTTHAPEMATTLAAAMQGAGGESQRFAVTAADDIDARDTISTGKLDLHGDLVVLGGYTPRTRPPKRIDYRLRKLLGLLILVGVLVLGVPAVTLPLISHPLAATWAPFSGALLPTIIWGVLCATIVGTGVLLGSNLHRVENSGANPTLHKSQIGSVRRAGCDLWFVADIHADPGIAPETVCLHTATPEEADAVAVALAARDHPSLSVRVTYSRADDASTLGLSGVGVIEMDGEKIGLTGKGLVTRRYLNVVPPVLMAGVLITLFRAGIALDFFDYLLVFVLGNFLCYSQLGKLNGRLTLPRHAVTAVRRYGRQLVVEMETPVGPRRAVFHTARLADAEAIAAALTAQAGVASYD